MNILERIYCRNTWELLKYDYTGTRINKTPNRDVSSSNKDRVAMTVIVETVAAIAVIVVV